MLRGRTRILSGAFVLLLLVIQFVQPDRTNPPADPAASFAEVAQPSPELATLLRKACGDCHSDETVWPWYSQVSPVSWLVANHVKEGRAHVNLSDWKLLSREASANKFREMCEEVEGGEMPLWEYQLLHPEARLTQKDVDLICKAAGTQASLPPSTEPANRRGERKVASSSTSTTGG